MILHPYFMYYYCGLSKDVNTGINPNLDLNVHNNLYIVPGTHYNKSTKLFASGYSSSTVTLAWYYLPPIANRSNNASASKCKFQPPFAEKGNRQPGRRLLEGWVGWGGVEWGCNMEERQVT